MVDFMSEESWIRDASFDAFGNRRASVQIALWILLVLTAVVSGCVVLTYDRLVALHRRTQEAWSDIRAR